MASVGSATQQLSTQISSEEQFLNRVVERIKLINKDYLDRISAFDSNPSTLEKGYFYANNYFLALKKLGLESKVESLRKDDAFYHNFTSSKYFEPNYRFVSGYKVAQGFKIKQGVTPSEALKELGNSLCLIDCGEACQIAYYQTLLEAIGEEKFDILFKASSKTPLTICFFLPNPLSPLLRYMPSFGKYDLKKGDIAYFTNIPDYDKKHLLGEHGGLFTVVSSEHDEEPVKFASLGLKAEGSTLEELTEVFRTEYNRSPMSTAILSDQLAKKIFTGFSSREMRTMKQLENSTISSEEFSKKIAAHKGFKKSVFFLDYERVSFLCQTPPAEIRKHYDSWYSQLR